MANLSKKAENLLMLIWAQALIAMLGSLFFSEIIGYEPCELCWYQRILMYPLVIIYGIAAYKRNLSIALPGLFLSGIGALVSIYHYAVQKLPALQEAGGSCGTVPCNLTYIDYFGFITIPFLAGIAFIIIFVLHVILRKHQREMK
ncbi:MULTISPECIES: disulfide oxidoreductase [Virgibacillus]|uniref:Probable disulfide formation protein n=2 Tax=Virgibacillus TaxID=84406 RepID=A0A024QDX0_9BACI|nr:MULTISPECIES: disulfide oxidoreductase [Virgibacillus]EQB35137.1 dihydroneopterin aldolase [Virgibacillus sp. CM-4]MYL42805.1 disulfide bond formation protein B [Virgibacillus massiliensis]GGJ69584.1 putative disulfide formation protein C [Virgibacillus kapii]CDQ40699.1 Thiol-disulfide oxidoreductase C [Virgibacillus massiliensis]